MFYEGVFHNIAFCSRVGLKGLGKCTKKTSFGYPFGRLFLSLSPFLSGSQFLSVVFSLFSFFVLFVCSLSFPLSVLSVFSRCVLSVFSLCVLSVFSLCVLSVFCPVSLCVLSVCFSRVLSMCALGVFFFVH